MKLSILFPVSGFVPALAARARDSFDPENFASEDIITRDVAVIGGGSSGTYAAIGLLGLGSSVVVVEREAVLGGHTDTYVDPETGASVDYGVQAFANTSVARDYFSHFNIPIINATGSSSTVLHADFNTGQQVSVDTGNGFAGFTEHLERYPYLESSWDLPSPVPEDLLLPFSEFIAKYGLEDIVYNVYFGGQGLSRILEQPTVYVMKLVSRSYLDAVSGNSVVPASHNNGELYSKATAQLGNDALLSSTVVAARRPGEGGDGVQLIVQTPSGQKLIRASKLLISVPPLLNNLKPFDLDETETGLFSQWSYSAYYTLLMNNTGLPSGYRFENAASAARFNIPDLPALYQVTESRLPGLFYAWYGSPRELTRAEIEADVASAVARLRAAVTSTAAAATAPPQVLAFSSHTPFMLTVPPEAISGGFYGRLQGLQGHRSTWYTGAAFLSHEAPNLWKFTKTLLPQLSGK